MSMTVEVSRSLGNEIIFVVGARPNFMKVAPTLRALSRRAHPFQVRLVHTGQHYDAAMSDVFFRELKIPPPDVHFGVGPGSHGAQTARVLEAFESYILASERPPCGVVVVGDVNSTVACTLAAVKLSVPVAHVEAGLRSFDRTMPEEINRVVTDSIADLLLTSEPAGEANLRREGIAPERIRFVGNVMIDNLVAELEEARTLDAPRSLGLADVPFALVTLHRPSNVDAPERLLALVSWLERVSERVTVVFPMHPRTKERIERFGLAARLAAMQRVNVTPPLGFHRNIGLMAAARLVVTDSGGVQEETTYLGVPCLTLRPNTERPITVSEGTNTVVGEDLERAEALVRAILDGDYKSGRPIEGWDGRAAERIVDVLVDRWSGRAQG